MDGDASATAIAPAGADSASAIDADEPGRGALKRIADNGDTAARAAWAVRTKTILSASRY